MRSVLGILILGLLLSCQEEAPKEVRIHLVGDSTMAVKTDDRRPETGWGEALHSYFNEAVTVLNHAKNGRSTRSFREEGHWQVVLDSLHAGDFVIIQFGHNDSKVNSERYASPHQYKKNICRMIREVEQKGASAIVATPIMRRRYYEDSEVYDTHGDYPKMVHVLADSLVVPMLDLHSSTWKMLTEYGESDSKSLFLWLEPGENVNYPDGVQDNTHLSTEGATVVAGLATKDINSQVPSLRNYLTEHSQSEKN